MSIRKHTIRKEGGMPGAARRLARMMEKYAASMIVLLIPAALYAQEAALDGMTGPRFFAALVSGVILAAAFQLVLTNLSAAAGLSMVHPSAEGRPEGGEKEKSGGMQQTVRKISTAFGGWALITTAISLFFAAWLGVRLSLVVGLASGATIGLVIWGLFFMTMLVLESRAISSLIGSLGRMASHGLRTAYDAGASVMKTSPEEHAADTAARITQSVKHELFGDIGAADLQERIQFYVNQMKPVRMEPAQIARSIADLLEDTEIKTVQSSDWHQTFLTFLEKETHFNKEEAKAVASGLKEAVSNVKESRDKTGTAAEMAMSAAGIPGKEAHSYREKVENYLRATGKQQLSPEGIKRDIEELFRHPKEGYDALKSRVQSIDKSAVAALLSQRKDMSPDEARRIVDRVDQVLKEIAGKASAVAGQAGETKGAAGAATENVISKIRDYLNSLNRPELRYDALRDDMSKLVHNPREGADSLIQRFKSLDRNTLKAIITSRKDISPDDAEKMLNRIEGLRDQYIERAVRMKDELAARLDQAKKEIMHQAEETRKTVASAAWLLFLTALVSGFAAAAGGMLGAL